jgi:hypothetical protein
MDILILILNLCEFELIRVRVNEEQLLRTALVWIWILVDGSDFLLCVVESECIFEGSV